MSDEDQACQPGSSAAKTVRYAQVVVGREAWENGEDPGLPDLKRTLEAAGFLVRVVRVHLYSYQGGEHNSFTEPHPLDWSGESTDHDHGDGKFAARDRDLLVCVASADRYGYKKDRNLALIEKSTAAEAVEYFNAMVDLILEHVPTYQV